MTRPPLTEQQTAMMALAVQAHPLCIVAHDDEMRALADSLVERGNLVGVAEAATGRRVGYQTSPAQMGAMAALAETN